MSTIKSDRKDFEMLLNGIVPLDNNSSKPVDNSGTPNCVDSSTDGFNVEKQFEFDYEGTKKILRKKARKTLNNIVKHIIPDEMLEDEKASGNVKRAIFI